MNKADLLPFSKITFLCILFAAMILAACSKTEEQGEAETSVVEESVVSEGTVSESVFEVSTPAYLRSEPAIGEVLARPPRTLRIYLSALPDIEKSSLTLSGKNGEVSLSRFHSMGADDLMIEIDDHPLPNGEYTVNWSAIIAGDSARHSGSFVFTVAVPE